MSEQLQYPLSKEEYGSSMWKVLHSYTANLPEKLSITDKKRFNHTLSDLIDRFPCSDCKEHATDYIKNNKPKGSTKRQYSEYLCEFHNKVNERLGKPTLDCSLLQTVPSCPTCSTSLKSNTLPEAQKQEANINQTKKQNRIDQLIDYKLNQSFGDYKSISTKIFHKMCENANVPVPELIFTDKTGCSDPERSCTHLTVDPKTKKLVDGTKVYFNVNQYSPRTAVHEALHYIRKAKGLDAFDEESIEKEARTIISSGFPMDNYNRTSGYQEAKDTPMEASYYKDRVARRLAAVEGNLPYFSRYYHPAKKHKKEEPAPQVVPTITYSDGRPVYPQVPTQPQPEQKPEPASATEGFTSMLNPIYAPFATALGLKPEDVNNAHTPALLANGALVLAESNLNKFGSMAVSLLSALTTLAIGTLAKDSIGFADKKLLIGLGGAFLWNGALRYIANPKTHEEVASQAMEFGQSLSGMDMEAMAASMTQDQPMNLDPEKDLLQGKQQLGPGRQTLHRHISAPLGGQPRKVGKRTSEYDVTSDIYEDPDATISSQGSFRRDDPFFPSMT